MLCRQCHGPNLCQRNTQSACLQGGIIHNEGIVSAFYEMFGARLRITPNYDVTGAYGAALEAKAAVSKHSADQEKNTEIYKKNWSGSMQGMMERFYRDGRPSEFPSP